VASAVGFSGEKTIGPPLFGMKLLRGKGAASGTQVQKKGVAVMRNGGQEKIKKERKFKGEALR